MTGIVEDTDRVDWLDEVYVASDPASIAHLCADYGHRVTLTDPGDPNHFGTPNPRVLPRRSTTRTAPGAYRPALSRTSRTRADRRLTASRE